MRETEIRLMGRVCGPLCGGAGLLAGVRWLRYNSGVGAGFLLSFVISDMCACEREREIDI